MLSGKLAELGVYEPQPRGRMRLYETQEEAVAAKRARTHFCQLARRQVIKDARTQGLEPPKFKRGRPKMYATEEEAKAAHREQNRLCKQRYNARVLQALENLDKLLKQRHTEVDDSSDEEKMFLYNK